MLSALISETAEGNIPGGCPWPAAPTNTYSLRSMASLGIGDFILALTTGPSLSWLLLCCVALMHEGNCFAQGGLLKIFIIVAASEVWFNLFWETLQRNLLVSGKKKTKPSYCMLCNVLCAGGKEWKILHCSTAWLLEKIWGKRKEERQLNL